MLGSPMSEERGRTFRRVRIAVLLSVLAIVLLYAWKDVHRRRERTTWERPLTVALVVMRRGPVGDAPIDALRHRSRDLEARLTSEYQRYRGGSGFHPFEFQIYGPVDVSAAPPSPGGDGVLDLLSYAWKSWRYFHDVDSRAEVPSAGFDSRIYLAVRPPASEQKKTVEGQSEQGGRVGSVEVELDESMVDFALFVATHELFHTLGATDKYDAVGRARVPDGLAEPDRVPRFPQRFAEVMARNVPLSPSEERPPDALSELAVGPVTAREIGWTQ
jgi:hypothetical protein